MSMKDEMSLLRATGAEVEMLDAGCCGMAGPFGFEKKNYEISQKLAERVLLARRPVCHRRYNFSKQRIQLPRTN